MAIREVEAPTFPATRPESPRTFRTPAGIERWALLYLVCFLLILPKGGLKLAGVPVTWGYLGLGVSMLWLPWALAAGRSIRIRKVRLAALALLVPFQAVSWVAQMVLRDIIGCISLIELLCGRIRIETEL